MQTTNSSTKGNSPKLIQWNETDRDSESHQNELPIKPGALLLTAAPMELFRDEFFFICEFALSFDRVVYAAMRSTGPHADQLRAALKLFSTVMSCASMDMCHVLYMMRIFYQVGWNRWGETASEGDGPIIDTESFPCLFDADFRHCKSELARSVATLAAGVARRLRQEVLPLLPELEKQLNNYITEFVKQYAVKLKRDQSWIPSILYNTVWGPSALVSSHQEAVSVVQLSLHLSTGIELLHKLPAFLDNLELHFRRLGEVDSQQLLDLGYATVEDFQRLFQDYFTSFEIASYMKINWRIPMSVFEFAASDPLP